MKKTDKFLIAIVAGVVLLVVVVFAIALLRPKQPAYQADDTPQGVAHNYLLALQLKDYERAHRYLSPELPQYPDTVDEFTDDVEANRWTFEDSEDVSLAVEAVNVNEDRAEVTVRKTTFYGGGLFDSGQYSNTFEMTLRRVEGAWRITDSDQYWSVCWRGSSDSRCK